MTLPQNCDVKIQSSIIMMNYIAIAVSVRIIAVALFGDSVQPYVQCMV